MTLEAGVEEVVELFKAHVSVERGHSRLRVVEHGRHVGLVTRADVLAALQQEG